MKLARSCRSRGRAANETGDSLRNALVGRTGGRIGTARLTVYNWLLENGGAGGAGATAAIDFPCRASARGRAAGIGVAGIGLEELGHDAEAHRQRAAQHLVGRLLDRLREVLADPLADEVIGNGNLQPILAKIQPR